MNNLWNGLIYKTWSPIYDRLFNTGHFLNARKEVFSRTDFHNNQKILFVGVGTGADLERINHKELDITAIDYSYDMLKKARAKFIESPIQFLKMDAQDMSFSDSHFDVVIGSLVLSVVPDSDKCLKEMLRVLKPIGEIIIFDKFIPKDKGLSPYKKALRPLIKLLGTDIGVNFEELYGKNKDTLTVKEDIPIMFNDMYRMIIIRKLNSEDKSL
ncbi:class I SAM-dependent methyltransferase [Alkalihalobacillus macyae]|uniref:class I SAM-dependent methyltransferase n=1 Tax=Guptibacillus hwajinpoensis TaxID=208199 RepID=UPI00273CF263|nr:class I SAM-dependent methyltransferase [Alkalihalobacillus macyae]MDP4553552.1 class I SAM-dependent methyltransferase [Alkalihalobacillus macyae]